MQIKVCHHYLKTIYPHTNVQITLISEIYNLSSKKQSQDQEEQ